jgi:rare lipoprotein A
MKPLDAAIAVLGPIIIGAVIALAFLMSTPHAVAAQPCAGVWVTASYYGAESGNRTATGERFDGRALTAAMPSRRHLGEHWRVTYAGRSVTVRVNDIGPAAWTHRGIDLSHAAARVIGLTHAGTGKVCLERLG